MTYSFANCRIDTRSRELFRDEQPIAIEPKTLDLLIYLLENSERAVGKDELQDKVWGTIVSDAALTRAVMKARKAVGDKTNDARVIKTVPRFGYRFIAAIDDLSSRGTPSPPADRRGIAVLPLANMSGDVENEYFSDGEHRHSRFGIRIKRSNRLPRRCALISCWKVASAKPAIASALRCS